VSYLVKHRKNFTFIFYVQISEKYITLIAAIIVTLSRANIVQKPGNSFTSAANVSNIRDPETKI